MAYESDVRRIQRNLSNAASAARTERDSVISCLGRKGQFWKGQGADSFSSEFLEISGKIEQAVRCVDRANNGLGRLPALISRAERERALEREKK